jgi:hypothetical protein
MRCSHPCYDPPEKSLSLPFLNGEGNEVRSGVLATADNETKRRLFDNVGGVSDCVTTAGLFGRDELPGRKGGWADDDPPSPPAALASVSRNSTQRRENDCTKRNKV